MKVIQQRGQQFIEMEGKADCFREVQRLRLVSLFEIGGIDVQLFLQLNLEQSKGHSKNGNQQLKQLNFNIFFNGGLSPQLYQPMFVNPYFFVYKTQNYDFGNSITANSTIYNSTMPFSEVGGIEVKERNSNKRVNPKFCKKKIEKYGELINEDDEQNIYCRISEHNILANNINLAISYIRRSQKSGEIVDRIISKHRIKNNIIFTSKKYYAYQFYLKENYHDFVHKASIEAIANHLNPALSLFSVQEQLFYNKVTRILITYYLREICSLDVIIASKIKKTAKRDHLMVHRYLSQLLRGQRNTTNKALYRL